MTATSTKKQLHMSKQTLRPSSISNMTISKKSAYLVAICYLCYTNFHSTELFASSGSSNFVLPSWEQQEEVNAITC